MINNLDKDKLFKNINKEIIFELDDYDKKEVLSIINEGLLDREYKVELNDVSSITDLEKIVVYLDDFSVVNESKYSKEKIIKICAIQEYFRIVNNKYVWVSEILAKYYENFYLYNTFNKEDVVNSILGGTCWDEDMSLEDKLSNIESMFENNEIIETGFGYISIL